MYFQEFPIEDIADILGAVTDDEILSTLSKPKLAIDDALISIITSSPAVF